jgi:hypothetical protein
LKSMTKKIEDRKLENYNEFDLWQQLEKQYQG